MGWEAGGGGFFCLTSLLFLQYIQLNKIKDLPGYFRYIEDILIPCVTSHFDKQIKKGEKEW
jgi:hypothetical protein